MTPPFRAAIVSGFGVAAVVMSAHAQDRLKAMPGYDQYTRMAPMYQDAVKLGSVLATARGRGWTRDDRR